MDLPLKYTTLNSTKRKRVREEYIKLQDNKCWYCKSELEAEPPEFITQRKVTPYLYPIGFFKNKIHLHHNHDTDLTLGAVHAYCNAVLWEYHCQ